MLWDNAPYHRVTVVRAAAASLDVYLLPCRVKPDPKGVEPLSRLPEDVTDHHCHTTTVEDPVCCVATFEAGINADTCVVADHPRVRDHLDRDEEKA